MKTTLCIAVSLLTALSALPSHSAPVQLSEAAFAGALAPLTGSVEDFEGFSSGFKSKPLQLANAVFVSDNPYVGLESQIAPTKILIDQAGDNVEVFSSFLPGTTVFGIDIFALNEGNEVNVTVVGGTGTSVFRSSFDALDGFFGVQDPLGLLSVSFQRLRNRQHWATSPSTTSPPGRPSPPQCRSRARWPWRRRACWRCWARVAGAAERG